MLKVDISWEYNAKGGYFRIIMLMAEISGEYKAKGGYFMRI